jgi:manganese oxidase
VVKVRDGLARNDYKDPGWYQHPPGTVAREWTGEAPPATQAKPAPAVTPEREFRARKPATGHKH